METLNNLLNTFEEENKKIIDSRIAWHSPNLSGELCWQLLKGYGDQILAKRHSPDTFYWDDDNREVIQQLYLYLIGHKACKLDINRGIYMMGAIGSGKTVLMKSFIQVQDYLTKHSTLMVHSKNLFDLIKEKGIRFLSERPMFIDDLGRENLEESDFGRKVKPIVDLFSQRYENGARTFATSNFKIETLSGTDDRGYGKFITSRMQEMFNVIELPGKSRRKPLVI